MRVLKAGFSQPLTFVHPVRCKKVAGASPKGVGGRLADALAAGTQKSLASIHFPKGRVLGISKILPQTLVRPIILLPPSIPQWHALKTWESCVKLANVKHP